MAEEEAGGARDEERWKRGGSGYPRNPSKTPDRLVPEPGRSRRRRRREEAGGPEGLKVAPDFGSERSPTRPERESRSEQPEKADESEGASRCFDLPRGGEKNERKPDAGEDEHDGLREHARPETRDPEQEGAPRRQSSLLEQNREEHDRDRGGDVRRVLLQLGRVIDEPGAEGEGGDGEGDGDALENQAAEASKRTSATSDARNGRSRRPSSLRPKSAKSPFSIARNPQGPTWARSSSSRFRQVLAARFTPAPPRRP